MAPRAYQPWDQRQQRAARLVTSEDELRREITALSGVGSSFNRLSGGGWIIIAGPLTITSTITIPSSCPGLTIMAASRFPITANVDVVFDVRAEHTTILDLLVVAGTRVPTTFVTTHDPASAGRSCTCLRVLGNVVFARSLYQDLSAGQASFALIDGNHLGQPDGTLPSSDAIFVDSFGCVVSRNDLVPGAGGHGLVVSANGSACRVADNYFANRAIVTSASGGSNSFAGNSLPGAKTLHASDVDDDAKPSGTGAANRVALWSGASTLSSLAPTSSAVLTTDGSGVPGWTTQAALLIGRLIRAPQVLASGTSYAKPAGCNSIVVELIGGGGGGGGASSAASSAACGGGGGSGGYARKYYDVSALAGPFTYAIGAGGTAGANTGGNGGTGGDTTFTDGTTLVTAKGGTGGGGMTAGTAATFTTGGAGQAGTNGDLNSPGGVGQDGERVSGTVGRSGAGAPSVLGAGGNRRIGAGAGIAGAGYGGGGGGGLVLSGSAAVAGAAGDAGVLIVWEYT